MSSRPRLFSTDDVPPQPWRNGGGRTRELLAWPTADDWALRISVADIEADGPFSAFPGVERWFAVIEGAGVVLRFGETERRVTSSGPPLSFDGGAAPGCRLIDGPTRDLNLMVRHGSGAMERAIPGTGWSPAGAAGTAGAAGAAGRLQCGLFAATAGWWHAADGTGGELSARTLLWFGAAPVESLSFFPGGNGPGPIGWWLRFSPA